MLIWSIVALVVAAVLAYVLGRHWGRQEEQTSVTQRPTLADALEGRPSILAGGAQELTPESALEALTLAYGPNLKSSDFMSLTEVQLSGTIRSYLSAYRERNPGTLDEQLNQMGQRIFVFLSRKQSEVRAAIHEQEAKARRLIATSGDELERELAKHELSDETKQRVRELDRMKADLIPKMALRALEQTYGKELTELDFSSLTDEQLQAAIEFYVITEAKTQPDLHDAIADDLSQRMFVVLTDMRAKLRVRAS